MATSSAELALYADQQVSAAERGSRLSDYRQAQNLSKFWLAPTSNEQAYIKSAYWLAVASRLLGSSALASAARWNLRKGQALAVIPGSGYLSGDKETILLDASRQVVAADPTGSNPGIRAVAKALGHQATWAEAQRSRESEASLPGTVATAVTESVKDVAQPIQQFREKGKVWPLFVLVGLPLIALTLYLLLRRPRAPRYYGL